MEICYLMKSYFCIFVVTHDFFSKPLESSGLCGGLKSVKVVHFIQQGAQELLSGNYSFCIFGPGNFFLDHNLWSNILMRDEVIKTLKTTEIFTLYSSPLVACCKNFHFQSVDITNNMWDFFCKWIRSYFSTHMRLVNFIFLELQICIVCFE